VFAARPSAGEERDVAMAGGGVAAGGALSLAAMREGDKVAKRANEVLCRVRQGGSVAEQDDREV